MLLAKDIAKVTTISLYLTNQHFSILMLSFRKSDNLEELVDFMQKHIDVRTVF
jgi:hypothetical protein